MDRCLKRQKVPKLTQEETDNPNRPTISKDTGVLDTKLPTKKILGLDSVTIEFYQTLKE